MQREAMYALAAEMLRAGDASARTIMAMGEIAAGLSQDQQRSRAEFAARFERFAQPSVHRRMTRITVPGPARPGLDGRSDANAANVVPRGRMKTLAVYNIKGGVGKTSAAVNLGYLAARDGLRTLIWDLDPQGSATFLFRVRPRVKGGGRALVAGRNTLAEAIKGTDFDGLDLMPADFRYRNLDLELDSGRHRTDRLRRLMEPLREDYDLVVLDCPPSASLVSENVVHACDVLLVPLIPATLSLRSFDQLTAFVAAMPGPAPRTMAFWSMVDRRKKSHREITDRQVGSGSDRAAVPNLAAIEQMADHRAPVAVTSPRSSATAAYERLWRVVAPWVGE